MALKAGLYEQLVTEALDALLQDPDWTATRVALSQDAAADLLARHIYQAARRALSAATGDTAARLRRQVSLTNRALAVLAELSPEEVLQGDAVTPEVLHAVVSKAQARLGTGEVPRPGIPLRHSELIVNGPRDRRVGLELARELPSADRVDLLMSFVKWSGFVELRDVLARYARRGWLRVLTTTYMGATEQEALEALAELGAEIRVSYDHRRTRLHAKAWLFHRESGFSTAIIGSSNLSHAALRAGCEWNVRLSQRDNPGLLAKFRTTFDQYWLEPAFEPYSSERFRETLARRRDPSLDALVRLTRLVALPHQDAVLDALATERKSGHFRNLIVAATGTGKTVMAALDYARQPGRPRLLFVAHRDRILEQSRATFRAALGDGNFGEKLTGREKPILGSHVFASIQSLHPERLKSLSPDAYEVVIVDEFHHAAAPTYETLLKHLSPRLLLGLTATPERADGRPILHYFDDRIAAESRLWDALDQELLSPFQYFVVHDGTDLSQIDFNTGRYAISSLEQLYTADEHRARQVLRELASKVRQARHMKALGFCVSVRHAEYMAAFFNRHGLPATVVHGNVAPVDRNARVGALERGEVCCIFTVDVFNEGVDIPLVDTVLFLRPTESATIFLQQLGRGLRLHDDKACLTVLDFVGTAHKRFRFDLRFRALLGGGTRAEITRAVSDEFPYLPSGCAIHLDERSQREIVAHLKRTLTSWAALADDLEPGMGLAEFLGRAEVTPEDLYRQHRTFTALRHVAGLIEKAPSGPIARALPRLLHVDDVERLTSWAVWLAEPEPPPPDLNDPRLRLLFAVLGHADRPLAEVGEVLSELWATEALREELAELVLVLDDRRRRLTFALPRIPLQVHAHYTRLEISAALDLRTNAGKLLATQAGVYKCDDHRCDLLFVTLDKEEKDFTPTTLYEDYVISPRRFHWESQSRTREDSPTGRRYRHPEPGWRILLFVRRTKRDARGITQPFLFLGPVHCISHNGERPMQITWELEYPVPGDWFQQVKIAAG